ncbi:hypothetical protein DMH17_15040 [Raoultella planticola]|nr:hypothetical protein [Raoultella planticola]
MAKQNAGHFTRRARCLSGEHAVSGKTCRYRGADSRLLASAKRMVWDFLFAAEMQLRSYFHIFCEKTNLS